MEELTICKSVDYITFSTDKQLKDMYLWHKKCKYVQHRKKHYQSTINICEGANFYASENPTQGNLVEISGEGMRRLRHEGLSDLDHLQEVSRNARNVTRVDYAIDLIGNGTDPHDLRDLIVADKIPNAGKKVSDGREGYRNDLGKTVYFGARESELFLRCYDASVKNSIKGVTWTRLELEMKKRRANQAVYLCNNTGVITSLDRLMVQSCDARGLLWWFDLAVSDLDMSFPIELPRKKTSFEKHLETVLKTIKKRALDPENAHLIAKFRTAINEIELPDQNEPEYTDDPMFFSLDKDLCIPEVKKQPLTSSKKKL